jgi:hypothetical protein
MNLDPIFYIVERLDGDYAQLRRLDRENAPLKSVARALLPDAIDEGTKLKFELFHYEIVP